MIAQSERSLSCLWLAAEDKAMSPFKCSIISPTCASPPGYRTMILGKSSLGRWTQPIRCPGNLAHAWGSCYLVVRIARAGFFQQPPERNASVWLWHIIQALLAVHETQDHVFQLCKRTLPSVWRQGKVSAKSHRCMNLLPIPICNS